MDSPFGGHCASPMASDDGIGMAATSSGSGMQSYPPNSSGTLRTKISLRKGDANATIVSPFILMKPELPRESGLSGSTNLLCHFGLDEVYKSVSSVRPELSAFLPNVPGNVDNPMGHAESSWLKMLIDKPPIVGKEIHPLTSNQLAGFKLQVGSLPDDYNAFCMSVTGQDAKATPVDKSAKHKRSLESSDPPDESELERRKKQKREDEKREKKKKKKEKKKKKGSSPQHP